MNTNKQVKSKNPKCASSKLKYEAEKRQSKPISFNKIKEKTILNIANNINFGVWVKNILSALTQSEISILMTESNSSLVPAVLVEKAIEDGFFSLEEYLESKGKKIVDIDNIKQEHDDSCLYNDYM